MSNPGGCHSSGISLGDALRLPKRHPAWRRREAQSGSCTERENLGPSARIPLGLKDIGYIPTNKFKASLRSSSTETGLRRYGRYRPGSVNYFRQLPRRMKEGGLAGGG